MNTKILTCFVASPSDTSKEREACDEVFDEINSGIGKAHNFRIESVKWEKNAYPDFGSDGQNVLNKQLDPGKHPFFVGIMWKHFGSKTPRAGSGTEEEFDQAYAGWLKDNTKNIQFYFNNSPPLTLDSVDPDQLGKVSEFQKKVADQGGLYAKYHGVEDFKKQLRENITACLIEKFCTTEEPSNDTNGNYSHHLTDLENDLKLALEAYKSQPEIFVVPKLTKSREPDKDDSNIIEGVITSPENALIVAPPEFGLTCLSLHMRVEAFKLNDFWVYIDASHAKSRRVLKSIEGQLQRFGKTDLDVKCIVIDELDFTISDQLKIIKLINQQYPDTPLILCSNNDGIIDPIAKLDIKNIEFQRMYLQPLTRNHMRKFVEVYDADENQEIQDDTLGMMASHLESINIHRTPLNCLTILRIKEGGFDEKLLNRTKLMKAILFVLFTDYESFSHHDKNPSQDVCTFVLGKFCKKLVKNRSLCFSSQEFIDDLKNTCAEELLTLNISAMIEILLDNNILVEHGDQYEFKHKHWVFYFAAEEMLDDTDFRDYVLSDHRYTDYPEIIDFYTGIDGKRNDVARFMLDDLKSIIATVDDKIGIKGEFNPLSKFLWLPSTEFVETARKEIAEKVESSNLPAEIKDRHADINYDPNKPNNQSINNFFSKYSVTRLQGSIAAASRALRNSTFIEPELKLQLARAIIDGWKELSKVIFWISPILAKEGRAAHDGLSLVLRGNFSDDLDKRLRQILTANPMNVVGLVKGDLSSKKIGRILYRLLKECKSDIKKHFLATFIIEVRPEGWFDEILEHVNLLHPSSFYLGNLLTLINREIELGYINKDIELDLKRLSGAVLSKRRNASKALLNMNTAIEPELMYDIRHKLPKDQLLEKYNPSSPEKFAHSLKKR